MTSRRFGSSARGVQLKDFCDLPESQLTVLLSMILQEMTVSAAPVAVLQARPALPFVPVEGEVWRVEAPTNQPRWLVGRTNQPLWLVGHQMQLLRRGHRRPELG